MARKKSRTRNKAGRSFGLKFILLGLLAVAALTVTGYALVRIPVNVATEAAQPVKIAVPTPSATASPGADPAQTLQTVRALVSGKDALTISVLGDSTGNSTGEWLDLWAKDLTAYGTVTIHMWDEKAHAWLPTPTVYQGGERAITIWNGSQPGSTYVYALERLAVMQPEKPSFMIHNYGHNKATQRTDAGAMDLMAAVDAKWGKTPAVVILQNPSRNSRQLTSAYSVEVLRGWAPRAGYPVVDVYSAFRDAGALDTLLVDDVHPNPAGSRIWADTIKAVLG